jgi:hypothetical protein
MVELIRCKIHKYFYCVDPICFVNESDPGFLVCNIWRLVSPESVDAQYSVIL